MKHQDRNINKAIAGSPWEFEERAGERQTLACYKSKMKFVALLEYCSNCRQLNLRLDKRL